MGQGGRTIRGRVVRILALPVAAMLLLLSVVVVEEFADYRLAARTDRAITLDLAVQALVGEVQTERGVTAGLLAGNEAFRAEVAPARQRTDREQQAVQSLATGDGELEDQVTEALDQMGALPAIRADADGGDADRAEVFDGYTEVIEELGEVYFALDNAADAQMRLGSEALTMLNAAKEVTARQRAFLNGVFSAGGFREGEFLQFVQLRSDRDIALEEFEEYATPTAIAAKDYLFSTGPATQAAYFEQLALSSGDGQPLQADPQAWWSSLTTVLDDMSQLARHIGSSLRARAEVLLDRANLRLAGLAAVVLLCIGGAIYLATGAARSIAGPLAGLAAEANRLAGEQLPEAVRRAVTEDEGGPPGPLAVAAGATVEVRQVADAFERVQGTAYALATEQAKLRRTSAESLANLGRRNQNLLRRQLGFITRLEQEEPNPAGLANLFELDHLATRMRRNAESLLVLVGAASPRQWSGPLPLTDVVRAAVSEVEEYRRVSLRRIDEAQVAGSVVSGLAHLLAELIENGLVFSPPDMDVEIHGRAVDGGYLIAVCDQGVGMSRADLDRANERLRGEGDFITAPARFLGHYVVGRLAAEMGVEVELARSPVTGVTARVMLPDAILAEPPALAAAGKSAAAQGAAGQGAAGQGAAGQGAAGQGAAGQGGPHTPRGLQPPRGPFPPHAPRLRAVEVDYVVVAEQPVLLPSPRPPAEEQPAFLAPPTEEQPGLLAPPTPAGADAFEEADAVARTVNGLRKRVPRARRTEPAAAPAARPESAAPIADSPEALRGRLTALRDGIRRGAENPPARSL
ncbi:sensor histidine kinase [Actinoplanes sp. NBC_00393]|uniref:sensor histidine kinase n=1 Tax=Actinoplanes sp. NBC_00393 TaxID=2975953 RepID=UPI003FA4705F